MTEAEQFLQEQQFRYRANVGKIRVTISPLRTGQTLTIGNNAVFCPTMTDLTQQLQAHLYPPDIYPNGPA